MMSPDGVAPSWRRLPGHSPGGGPSAATEMVVAVALCALVLVAASGFERVYAGTRWALPVAAGVLAAGVTTFVARRAGLGEITAVACGLLAVWVAGCDLVLWDSTQIGLPLLNTLRAASEASGQAASSFTVATAPAQALPGFVLWSAWAAGTAMVASDWLAFRKQSVGAIVPPLLVFVSTCILGVRAGCAWVLAAFIVAALLFALAHQWASKTA